MFLETQTFRTNESRLCVDWERWGEVHFSGHFLVFEVAGHPRRNGQAPVGFSQAPV